MFRLRRTTDAPLFVMISGWSCKGPSPLKCTPNCAARSSAATNMAVGRGWQGGAFTPKMFRMPAYDCSKCPAYCCSYDRILVNKRDLKRLAKHFGVDEETAHS